MCVNKDQDYLLRIVSLTEVRTCTEAKEAAGKAEFPHHEVIKQIVTFWLLRIGVVSKEYSETL